MSESIRVPFPSLLSATTEAPTARGESLRSPASFSIAKGALSLGAGGPELQKKAERQYERTFHIETFGCQMNEHDSEKVAGVLLRRGYRQVASPDEARLVFYNTCSIREKAAQKVFSRLGEFNPKNNFGQESGKVIGVLGCVAQQEGEKIFARAPWVSLVCGSASYRKLPLLLARLEAGEDLVTGLDTDTD